ncbi:diguanylate cyclase, partial [Undibacterium sp. BYS50W]|nr:diguanylate cyclase [Undibacterium rugosum]
MQGTTVLKASTEKQNGTFVVKSAQDGVVRINGFQRLDKYPLFVSAALAKEEVLEEWLKDVYSHAATVAILILALASFGFYLIKQMKLRLNAEAEILKGQAAMAALNR